MRGLFIWSERSSRFLLAALVATLAAAPMLTAPLEAQSAPIQVPNPSGFGDPVTLLGIEAIIEGPCAGVVDKELPPWLLQTRVETDPKVSVSEGVYVVHRGGGKSVNERALETGCAALKNVEGLVHEKALRDAAARGAKSPFRMMTADTAAASAPRSAASSDGSLTWTGAGRKATETFQTSAQTWRVSWSLKPDDAAVGAVLNVTVRREDGILVDTISSGQIGAAASDVSVVRSAPGKYYLEIAGVGGTWQIQVATR